MIQDADVELVIDDTTQQQLNTQQQQNHVRVSNSTHGTKKGKGKERGNTGEQTTKSRKKKKKHRNKKKHSSSKQHQTPQLDHDDKENRTHGRAPTSCPPPAAVGNGDGANGMANGYAHHPHHHDTTNRKRTGLASRRENGIKRQETHVANAGKRTEKDKDTSHCRQKTEPVFDVGSHLASVRNQLLSYKGASDDGEDEEIEDLLEELHERWHQIDLNKSGFVSRKELVHAVWMSNGNGASSPPAWAQFPAHLQAMVEDIMVSVKEYESGDIAELNTSLAEEERSEDQRFSFWQFANYFVRQEDPNCQILISM